MATDEGDLDFLDIQSSPTSYLLTLEDITPAAFLMEDVMDDAESQPTPATATIPSPSRVRQTRNRVLRKRDWEGARPLITYLYKYKNMTVNEVMETMGRCGFHAGRSTLMSHIARWGIKKTSTASEKEAAIKLTRDSRSGPNPSTTSSIPPHLLERYMKDCQRRARRAIKTESFDNPQLRGSQTSSPSAQGFPQLIDATNISVAQDTKSGITNANFIYSHSDRSSELFLKRVKEYIQVFVDADAINDSSSPREDFHYLLDLAQNAWEAREPTPAQKWLEKASSLAGSVLQMDNGRLIMLLENLLGLLTREPQVGRQFIQFLAEMAKMVFQNDDHCMVHILQLFLQITHQDAVLERAGQIAVDAAEQSAPESSTALALIQLDVISMYASSSMYDAALRMAKRGKKFCLATFGPKHRYTRVIRSLMSNMYFKCRQHDLACRKGKSLLQFYTSQELPPDDIIVRTSIVVGDAYLELGLPDVAMEHYSSVVFWLEGVEISSVPCHSLYSDVLEYSQRMIYNIKHMQLQSESSWWFQEVLPVAKSVPWKLADTVFIGSRSFANEVLQKHIDLSTGVPTNIGLSLLHAVVTTLHGPE